MQTAGKDPLTAGKQTGTCRCSAIGSAHALGAWGCEFESHHLHWVCVVGRVS